MNRIRFSGARRALLAAAMAAPLLAAAQSPYPSRPLSLIHI